MSKARRVKPPRRRTFLQEWRKFRNLTQERAAERIGIEQATLSRIERGLIPYNQDFLETAALAYQCEPPDLLMRNPLHEDAVWSVTDNLRRATPEQKETARAVIDALLKKAS